MLRSRQGRMLTAGRMLVICVTVSLAACCQVSAHEGPPFPILMDKPLNNYIVSVWADPDIGQATFFVIVESPSGGLPKKAPQVSLWVEPIDGRLDRVTYVAEQQSLRNQMQFQAQPYFDARDHWTVGIRLTTSDGQSAELTTQVESTPPGFGPWDLAIYLFPFLFFGGMWALAMVRRSRMSKDTAHRSEEAFSEPPLLEAKMEDGA